MNMIQKSIFVNRSCSNNNNSNNNRNCISSDSTVQGVILWHSLFTGIQSKNINKNMSFHMCAVGLHRIISTGSPLGTSGCSTQLILEGHVASYLQDRTYLRDRTNPDSNSESFNDLYWKIRKIIHNTINADNNSINIYTYIYTSISDSVKAVVVDRLAQRLPRDQTEKEQ